MKTADVKAALRSRFCAPEWALFFEVGDATGAQQNRWADAVAMNLYPSRGLEVHGFEIKVSRSDWLRELKNPAKSAPVQRFCDRWWVTAPDGVILDGELPPTWGHYEAQSSGKLRQVVAAPKLETETINRAFVAAMLRRASALDEDLVKAAVSAEVGRLRQGDEQRVSREIELRTRRFKEAQEAIAEIEAISGVAISQWGNSEQIGRAVKAVLTSGVLETFGGIEGVRKRAAAILTQCDEALALFSSAETKVSECNR
ncbi:TPA: hypothetical protein QDB07_001720 [Burkholderia vietnamiensis]|uniref:hypothetical protein n=1 Tax=Burkholderia vietnamiensis TaxID=60552 RepID=UPI001B93B121|nr:hypothetical protein [Burkholderia vietnamiensis]MBR8085587.1 hypothetical protein [Burkholderia vietnamiensis]HDR9034251.1 hypothetical protein [Burkholderia vietnamiensis]